MLHKQSSKTFQMHREKGKSKALAYTNWHIGSIRMYFSHCIVTKSSLLLEKHSRGENRDKKAWQTQGFEFLSVRKKVRPSAGKLSNYYSQLKKTPKYWPKNKISWDSDENSPKDSDYSKCLRSGYHLRKPNDSTKFKKISSCCGQLLLLKILMNTSPSSLNHVFWLFFGPTTQGSPCIILTKSF